MSDIDAEMIDIYEVVTKLVGPIKPVGETNTDSKRLENLKEMCDLVERLLNDIDDVTRNTRRYEASMKQAGHYASNFLAQRGIDK